MKFTLQTIDKPEPLQERHVRWRDVVFETVQNSLKVGINVLYQTDDTDSGYAVLDAMEGECRRAAGLPDAARFEVVECEDCECMRYECEQMRKLGRKRDFMHLFVHMGGVWNSCGIFDFAASYDEGDLIGMRAWEYGDLIGMRAWEYTAAEMDDSRVKEGW